MAPHIGSRILNKINSTPINQLQIVGADLSFNLVPASAFFSRDEFQLPADSDDHSNWPNQKKFKVLKLEPMERLYANEFGPFNNARAPVLDASFHMKRYLQQSIVHTFQ